MEKSQKLITDPRFFQLVSLATLLTTGLLGLSFDTSISKVVMTLVSCQIFQFISDRLIEKKSTYNWSSALITSFSLSLLLRTNHYWVILLASAIAIFSKIIFRINGKHFFNPANIGIVIMLLLNLAWVSVGQWGQSLFLVFLIFILGGTTLWKSLRLDLGFFFLFTWSSLVIGRALYVGDPMTIPLHRLSSGSLLLFSFFMITDPRSTPSHPIGRLVFAFSVAVLGWWFQTFYFKQDALFYSLFFLSMFTHFIDIFLPWTIFQWKRPT